MPISVPLSRSGAALRSWASDGTAICIVGLVTATFSLSYTALLFGGAPGLVPSQGLFVMLASSIVLCTVVALLGTLPFAFNSLEGSSAAAMAGGTAAITAALTGAPDPVVAATLLVGLAVTAVTTGAVTLALATTGYGAAVRYLPLQVVAGLLSGAGWALLAGGVAVAAGHRMTPYLLIDPQTLIRIAPAFVAMAVLIVGTRLWAHSMALPVLVVAEVAAYHIGCGLAGWPLAAQRTAGWLLQPAQGLQVIVPWSPSVLGQVDWGVLAAQWPALLAATTVTVVATLLNLSGLEIACNRDADVNSDLRASGIANLVSGLCGGAMGMLSLSRSMLLLELGSGRRSTTVATGVLAGLLPMLAPEILGLVPRPILAALLLYVAFGILKTWLVDVRTRLTRVEWMTVLAVVLLVIQFGLIAGVVAGVALGCATFAVMCSRASPIRARFGGDVARSHVARPEADQAMLLEQAGTVIVLYLQGFLFFGTANRLLRSVKDEVAHASGQLRYLVLDGSNIDGLDGSARATLERLARVTAQNGITLVFTGFPDAAGTTLSGLFARGPRVWAMATLDGALETIEDALLAGAAPVAALPVPVLLTKGCEHAADAVAGALTCQDVPGGTVLMQQGEASDHLVFIESGSASVMLSVAGTTVRARRFGPGTMVGEIGFLLGKPRTATVRTDGPARIWVLTRERLMALETDDPDAAMALHRAMTRLLSQRLLDKDALIESLLRGARGTGSPGT